MASKVELEYPLAGSSVGFTFPAGGDFDWNRGVALPRPLTGPHLIRCVLTYSNQQITTDVPIAAAGSFPWTCNFSVPLPSDGTTSYQNCTITATHINDTGAAVPGDVDTAANITIGNAAPGQPQPGGTIFILPPP